jgi:uncharacterized LabA/DUF88 family protein
MSQKNPNYAFIDSQNLNLGTRSSGWKVDYRKLRLYLRNKYNVQKAFMFIGLVADNQSLYTELQSAGFILVFKPTVRYFVNGKETVKGNVDAELVLYAAAIEYPNYSRAIIVSGDGDFACLAEFLAGRDKLLHLLTPNHKYSKLLQRFASYIVRANQIRPAIEYKKDRHRRSVETLGLSGHGDTKIIAKQRQNVNKRDVK